MTSRPIELRAVPTAAPSIPAHGEVITNITFEPAGLTVEFVRVGDVKTNGVMMAKTLFIPHATDYDDEIDAVIDAAQALVIDVLEDFDCLAAKDPADLGDDDRGMGE